MVVPGSEVMVNAGFIPASPPHHNPSLGESFASVPGLKGKKQQTPNEKAGDPSPPPPPS